MLEQINKALYKRFTSKSFLVGGKIDEKKYQMILESIRMTPTSFGLQAFKVIEITDDSKKLELQKMGYNQPQIGTCDKLLIFAIETNFQESLNAYLDRIVKVKRQDEKGANAFGEYINGYVRQNAASVETYENWAIRQLYIALGFALETASLLEVESAPMEGFIPSQVDEYLELEKIGLKSVVLLTLGVGTEDDKNRVLSKVRKNIDEIIVKI